MSDPRHTSRLGLMAEARAVGQLCRDPILAIWMLYILLSPVYVFKSGLPQPGEFLLLLLVPLTLRRCRSPLTPQSRRSIRWLGVFLGYVTLSAIAWSIYLRAISFNLQKGFLASPLFYVYNAMVFVIARMLFQRYGRAFLWLTVKVAFVSLLMQALLAPLVSDVAGRANGLFNSANQLGYFAVLSAALVVFGQAKGFMSSAQTVVGVTAAMYLTLLGASRAALASLLLLLVIALASQLRTVIFAALATVFFLGVIEPAAGVLDKTMARIEQEKSYKSSFVEERGYDRVVEHPEYWLLGAGEGAYRRYAKGFYTTATELHSSVGTLFFCYGLLGISTFLLFVYHAMRGTGLRTWMLLMAAAAYGLSHQGLRFTHVWILLAVLADGKLWHTAQARALGTRAQATRLPQHPRNAAA